MKKFFTISIASFGLLSAIFVFVPVLRKPLVREDLLLEMVTAVLFLWVAVVSTRYLLRRGQGSAFDWLIPGLATLGFLEEVSFGRVFFEETPVVEGIKIDALHDYLRVLLKYIESGEHLTLIGAVMVLILGGTIYIGFLSRDLINTQLRRSSFRFTALCLVFVGFASIVDLDFVTHYYMVFVEEFTEALAAFALLSGYGALRDEESFDYSAVSEQASALD